MVEIIFSPDRFVISMDTEGCPLNLAWDVTSLYPRLTLAMSFMRMMLPSGLVLTTSSERSAAFSISPGTLTPNFPVWVSSAPAVINALFRATAAAISSNVMRVLSISAGLSSASRTGVRSPVILAVRISGMPSSSRCKYLARLCSSRSGAVPKRLITKIGKLEVLSSSTIGSRASAGNSARARSTFSRTSLSARS